MESQTFEHGLILISPPEEYPQEIQWLNQLFAKGLGTFHLRKPGWSGEKLLAYLQKVEEQYHSRIMVHYRQEVIREVGVKGIHFQYHALPQLKPPYTVSCGLHSWHELEEVAARVDYAFVSPFFDSISKAGYKANHHLLPLPQGVDKRKVVALGGIDAGNIEEVRKMGLQGAAVLGAVWNTTDPVAAFLKLKDYEKI